MPNVLLVDDDEDTRTLLHEGLQRRGISAHAVASAAECLEWVRDHDVDVVVPEDVVEQAAEALAAAGFQIERPPEDWLFKAWHQGVLVDVLHRLVGVPVDHQLVAEAEQHDVLGVRMPVLTPTVVMTTKVLALSEQYCDLGTLLPGARAVRERINWAEISAAAADHPFAEAFLFLARRLGISP